MSQLLQTFVMSRAQLLILADMKERGAQIPSDPKALQDMLGQHAQRMIRESQLKPIDRGVRHYSMNACTTNTTHIGDQIALLSPVIIRESTVKDVRKRNLYVFTIYHKHNARLESFTRWPKNVQIMFNSRRHAQQLTAQSPQCHSRRRAATLGTRQS